MENVALLDEYSYKCTNFERNNTLNHAPTCFYFIIFAYTKQHCAFTKKHQLITFMENLWQGHER